MGWTEPRVEKLRSMYAEGYSASIIGDRLGVSRNAVIGKSYRLRLPARSTQHAKIRLRQAPATAQIIALCTANVNLTLREICDAADCSMNLASHVTRRHKLPFRRLNSVKGEGPLALGKLAKSLGLTADDLRRMAPK